MKDVMALMRPNILALEPYSTARDEWQGGDIDVWIDANESPYDNGVNRYPDPHHKILRAQLSEIKGVGADSIFIGNGSDEAIDILFRVFARPGVDNAVSIAPTYGMYKVAAATNDVAMREVQLNADYSLPVDKLLAACDENTKLMWVCSPNNPTGNSFEKADIERLITGFNGVVVVDEAYVEFASNGGFAADLAKYPNLVILQTLSKAWGMAGLRFGLALANADIITIMNRVKYPYNINVLTQARVSEELKKDITSQVSEILEQRSRLAGELSKCECIEAVYPSDANFLLVKVTDADRLYDALVEQGVIVRNRSKVKGCESTLRITVGSSKECDRVIKVVKDFR
ncbi:MAG: histidinol-phosphate transaminase [Rikenellaceae bacterium]